MRPPHQPRLPWTDHKRVGLQYGLTASAFLLLGFLLMLLFRWQLAWPGQPLPAPLGSLLGDANAPGGFMLPEFYNQLVAMHGTVMIFLAVVPLLAGAFANYLVPLQIGASDMVFPRLNAASYWTFLPAGLLMLGGFFVNGGAANSGWTSYPPLAILATRGQDFWLGGMFLLGISSTLNAVTVIATIVQARTRGLTLLRLPFLVWAQLVSALLLLMAFPALQAAVIFQLLDRLAGTSFFLPSGLVVGGMALQGPSGGGNPLLWQHLFWFLAHPEVYVLILPALGIVAEIITCNARRPIWHYRLMVGSVLFLGVMSMAVWAHHMFLTGMGTTLGGFFQVTTMIISVPSVILVTCLVLTLWGGSIRFTVPMLFALAFLPMFGLGGLTGLPLGLAASDIALHDTYYVVGHFHYLVAPGTLFAIFAGIYHWFPKITGRRLHAGLGHLHFWGSLLGMNAIFLPMFAMGLLGVNRRLYDAGQQYLYAQPVLAWNAHMTWAAVMLGLVQIPFLLNLAWSWRRGAPAGENPWGATTLEWTAASPPPHANFPAPPTVVRGPYEYSVPGEPEDFLPQARSGESTPYVGSDPYVGSGFRLRAERFGGTIPCSSSTGITTAALGMWLFLASDVMLMASLFSGYVLLRASAASVPRMPGGPWWMTGLELLLLAATLAGLWRATTASAASRRPALAGAAAAAALLAILEVLAIAAPLRHGVLPRTGVLIASWFTLTAAHALHVVAGALAIAWLAATAGRTTEPRAATRLHATRMFWCLIAVIWLVLAVTF